MTAGEHEAIAVGPHGLFRVVAKYALPQRVNGWSGSHRRTRVSGIRLLDGINRKCADRVDRKLIDIAARKFACLVWNHSQKTSSIYFAAAVFFPDSSSSYQLIRAESGYAAAFGCGKKAAYLSPKACVRQTILGAGKLAAMTYCKTLLLQV
jgi:hypothetical protein